jgi:hypothetical protein
MDLYLFAASCGWFATDWLQGCVPAFELSLTPGDGAGSIYMAAVFDHESLDGCGFAVRARVCRCSKSAILHPTALGLFIVVLQPGNHTILNAFSPY